MQLVQFVTNRGTQLVTLGVDNRGRNWYIPFLTAGQNWYILVINQLDAQNLVL